VSCTPDPGRRPGIRRHLPGPRRPAGGAGLRAVTTANPGAAYVDSDHQLLADPPGSVSPGLASDLGVPHVELDELYHGPGWTPADPDMFHARVRLATAEPAWVIDGNYTSIVGHILRDRAGLVIALDLPRGVSWPGSPAARSDA